MDMKIEVDGNEESKIEVIVKPKKEEAPPVTETTSIVLRNQNLNEVMPDNPDDGD